MTPESDPSAMNVDTISGFEVAYKIFSILDSEHWKNSGSDLEAVAITGHLQDLTAHLLATFSESKQNASAGETICQNMLAVCTRMRDVGATKTEIDIGISQVSQKMERLAGEAKKLEERLQAARAMVEWILTSMIAATSESERVSQVQERVEANSDPSFEDTPAIFSQVEKDLLELKLYLPEMISIWAQVHQQVAPMIRVEKASINNIDVACMRIHRLYRDLSSRIESLFKFKSFSNLFSTSITDIEERRDDIDQEFEAILPSFHVSLGRDMQNTFESACACATILEPWNQATSRHPLANAIIERTQAEFAKLFDLLSMSKDVAQKGIKLIRNISYLCGTLLESTQESIQLNKFIDEVMPATVEARRQSSVIKANFQVTMISFTQISREIPTIVTTIQEEKEKDRELATGIQGLTIRKALRKMFRQPTLATVEGNIRLPFPLPFLFLFKRAPEGKVDVNKEREFRLLRADEALATLKDAGVFISEVGKGLAHFIRFWMSINMSLESVKERLEEMREFPDTWKLRLEVAKSQWEETASIYHHYVLQIGFLCQMIPPAREITSPGPRIRGLLD